MNKIIIGSIATTIIAIGGIVMLTTNNTITDVATQNNVIYTNDGQTIAITAKGGYAPRFTEAKADTPTTINITTNGSYDCSTAFTIPSLGIRKDLPPSGTTAISIPPQKSGATVKGLCSMGMYYFTIAFK